MNVTESTLRMAFFRVYREVATDEAHPVSLHEVKDAWHLTGLRHSDLPVALQNLIRSHLLQPMETDRIATVQLNEAGLRAFHERTVGLRRLQDWLTLARTGLRRAGMALPQRRQRGRRRQDHR